MSVTDWLVEHKVADSMFVVDADGYTAVLAYKLFTNGQGQPAIDFTSTFVPPELRGKGIAEKLVRAGIQWATENGYTLQASCWYVAKFIRGGAKNGN